MSPFHPFRPMRSAGALAALLLLAAVPLLAGQGDIPLPEHPRPGFERADWINLNGPWRFRFDPRERGMDERWFDLEPTAFRLKILVPFPWGSPLSGVADEADVAWYGRRVTIPESWEGRRIFLCVGASDWRTRAWLDGHDLGSHQGGYTPFEMELTRFAEPGREHRLFFRVDDSPHPFKLEGKQGYGPARGLWQTVYLEARPAAYLESFEFRPDLEREQVEVRVRLANPAASGTSIAATWAAATSRTSTIWKPSFGVAGSPPPISWVMSSSEAEKSPLRTGPSTADGLMQASSRPAPSPLT